MPKSQSAMEFIVLASFLFLVVIGFFAVTSSNILNAKEEGNKKTTQDIAEFAYKEIETAKSVNDGYVRVFLMPRKVNGADYTIRIIDDRELVVNYLGNEYVKFLPANVSGDLGKGLNEILKINGVVYIKKVPGPCENGIDDDGDGLIDASDPGCYGNCDYLNPMNYVWDWAEYDACSCNQIASCCPTIGSGVHYSVFDSSCATAECWSRCFGAPVLTLKNNLFNVLYFLNEGHVILRGTLQQNTAPVQTSGDEFVFKDRNGMSIAVVNLATGNMQIRGSLSEGQASLNPSGASNDLIMYDPYGNVVSYIDEQGNLRIKGNLIQNGGSILD